MISSPMEPPFVVCRSSTVPHRYSAKHCENETPIQPRDTGRWEDDAEEVRKALGDLVYIKKDLRSKDAFVRFERLLNIVRRTRPARRSPPP